jgi:uncharacterized protein (TIGR03435 family)
MLRELLAERFDLKVHNDNRPLPVFVLTGGRNRAKMKPSDGGQTGCQSQPQAAAAQPGTIPYNEVSCHNLTSAAIAEALRQIAGGYLDRPVLDQTNLEGAWDFTLKWTSRPQLSAAGSDGISIFDAVEKQLGLNLESQQAPMPVMVVDNVNRRPTSNAPDGETLRPENPEFEAADIKPSPPGTRGDGMRYTQGGRVDARGTLRDLIAMANEILPSISADSVVGPKFIETTHFTIVAKTPSAGIGAPTRVEGREVAPPLSVALMMLRSMLEDRFKLKTHKEDRPAISYALTAKGETKLKKPDASDRAGCRPDPGAIPASASGTPLIAVTCLNTTMAELIQTMPRFAGGYLDHPLVDHTGLQGGWNFTILFTPPGAVDNRPSNAQLGVASDPGAVSIFEGLEKLGLKLEKGTNTIPVIVVDHVEEKPVD